MENGIYHYGVKGMRWGVRRTPAQLGHQTAFVSTKKLPSGPDAYLPKLKKTELEKKIEKIVRSGQYKLEDGAPKHKPSKYAIYAQKQKVSEMSDQELQQTINRKLKEKQYKDLTKSPYIKAGEKIVNGIVIAAGTELAKEIVKKNLRKGLETVLNNAANG